MSWHKHPLSLIIGLVIWSIWFIFIYSALSVACAIVPPAIVDSFTWINSILLVSTLITTILQLYLALGYWQKLRLSELKDNPNSFILWVAVGGFLAAAFATLSIGLMVLFFRPCL
ncbi:hypothetical protein [Legionella gresilensis]|uniref:hypothetical protein n=1 Tax=Legionella gresilensis TaxID=91823 RepID=UPI001041888B|nr:hypothetical protein [Legionella gresilensis]